MSGREIRTKIASIKNTQKITKATELVAASKMREAQRRMSRSEPYAQKARQVIKHLAESRTEYRHPYLVPRERKNVGVILVSTDRGLCGSLNVNLFRELIHVLKRWNDQGVKNTLCNIGLKADGFTRRFGGNVIARAKHLGDNPSITDLIGVVKVMLAAYDAGEVDAIYLAYNHFVNSMTQKPVIQQLLPIENLVEETSEADPKSEKSEKNKRGYWDYIYEPDARELLDILLTRYVESQVYQAVVDNLASEQAARMMAMKSASDNAGNLIDELQLIYNKARQATITREISEIVGGAAAIE